MLIHHEIKPQGERVACSTEETIAANEASRGLARMLTAQSVTMQIGTTYPRSMAEGTAPAKFIGKSAPEGPCRCAPL